MQPMPSREPRPAVPEGAGGNQRRGGNDRNQAEQEWIPGFDELQYLPHPAAMPGSSLPIQ